MSTKPEVRFKLGQVISTPGALEALQRNKSNGLEFLHRHISGDWGIVCQEDKLANDIAVKTGARLLSAYFLPDETILWLITEAQDGNGTRQATTFLLPEEY
jgi:hypothetical protein